MRGPLPPRTIAHLRRHARAAGMTSATRGGGDRRVVHHAVEPARDARRGSGHGVCAHGLPCHPAELPSPLLAVNGTRYLVATETVVATATALFGHHVVSSAPRANRASPTMQFQ